VQTYILTLNVVFCFRTCADLHIDVECGILFCKKKHFTSTLAVQFPLQRCITRVNQCSRFEDTGVWNIAWIASIDRGVDWNHSKMCKYPSISIFTHIFYISNDFSQNDRSLRLTYYLEIQSTMVMLASASTSGTSLDTLGSYKRQRKISPMLPWH